MTPPLSPAERATVLRFEEAPDLPESWSGGLALIGDHLRAHNWTPDRDHPCGCGPTGLCGHHSEQRAVEHYRLRGA